MCDAYIPTGAFPEAAERALPSKVTDLLLLHEGVAPANQAARALAWVFAHRNDMYVAGAGAQRLAERRREQARALLKAGQG